jgi:hypothetical protein
MKKAQKSRYPAHALTGINALLMLVPIFLFMVFANQSFAQNNGPGRIRAIAGVSKARAGLGEALYYSVTVYSDGDIEIIAPELEHIGCFEVKDSGLSERVRFGRRASRFQYLLRGYQTGEKIIPGITLRYRVKDGEWNSLKANDVNVYIESVFEKSKIEADIRPIEPPMGLRFAYTRHIVFSLLFSLGLAYAGYGFLRYRKSVVKRRSQAPARGKVLYKQISQRLKSPMARAEPGRDDFISLAELIKEYVQFNLELGLYALTTEEFLHSLKKHGDFFSRHAQGLSYLLRTCDLVKFANYKPDAGDHEKALSLAKDIMRDISPEEAKD